MPAAAKKSMEHQKGREINDMEQSKVVFLKASEQPVQGANDPLPPPEAPPPTPRAKAEPQRNLAERLDDALNQIKGIIAADRMGGRD